MNHTESQTGLCGALSNWHDLGRPHVPSLRGKASGHRTCPSYPADSGGTTLANRTADGGLQFIKDPPSHAPCDAAGPVRLSGPCITTGCGYWREGCQLGAILARAACSGGRAQIPTPSVSSCPIRATCRWVAENGLAACVACASVDYYMSSPGPQPDGLGS